MEQETKRFRTNDNGFVCGHCGKTVEPLGFTSRNHCPFCLWSLHVDENPGDRACSCGGQMEPISAEPDSRRGYIITHRCVRCGGNIGYAPRDSHVGSCYGSACNCCLGRHNVRGSIGKKKICGKGDEVI